MPREKHQFDLGRAEAEALRQAASDSFATLQIAHLRYEHALEIVEKGALSPEAAEGFRRQGREYAEAVTRYSTAAMEWLAFMKTIK